LHSRVMVTAMVLLAIPASAPAQSKYEDTDLILEFIQDYQEYNGRCRGGSGNEVATWHACGARDYVGYLLSSLGWCYGEAEQSGDEMRWHPCHDGSDRFPRP
jgi:hypothetical protein